jgi:hypothetical protein
MGTIIFSLGEAINGVDVIPAEPLQILPRRAPIREPERHVPASKKSWAEAIDWWVMRLNQMFGYLSDPTSYRDAHGKYLPYHHLNWMMNGEELFNRVSSSMLSWRDQYGARILTFSALDLVSEVFLGGDMSALCKPDRALKALETIKRRCPKRCGMCFSLAQSRPSKRSRRSPTGSSSWMTAAPAPLTSSRLTEVSNI